MLEKLFKVFLNWFGQAFDLPFFKFFASVFMISYKLSKSFYDIIKKFFKFMKCSVQFLFMSFQMAKLKKPTEEFSDGI